MFSDAIKMLESLSGKTHEVITGIAIVAQERHISDFERTYVTFKELSHSQIERYVNDKKPLDKAGAYGIQEIGGEFVETLEGSYENVMGLPVFLLRKMLEISK